VEVTGSSLQALARDPTAIRRDVERATLIVVRLAVGARELPVWRGRVARADHDVAKAVASPTPLAGAVVRFRVTLA
jgi:hypothetical protein